MRELPIQSEATITGIRKPGVFDARLPNGKLACAHLSKSLAAEAGSLAEGSRVMLELTPFDFDIARISRILGRPPEK